MTFQVRNLQVSTRFNPLVPDAHYSERQAIFFTNSTIRSRFNVKMRIFIFCTLGTNGLKARSPDSWLQSWALEVFLIFSNNKSFFAFFIKLIWLGVGFLNRTGAEIGWQLYRKCKKSFFIIQKIKKIPKRPSSKRPSSVHELTAVIVRLTVIELGFELAELGTSGNFKFFH